MAGRIAYYGGIVKDGLVLNLDAAKTDSYPKIGTAWNDISGNRNNSTLTNGPTFDSRNGGSIVLDGVNDYVELNNLSSLYDKTNVTVECWFYNNSAGSSFQSVAGQYDGINGWVIHTSNITNYNILILVGGGASYGGINITPTNTWINVVLCYNGSLIGDQNRLKLYINGNARNFDVYNGGPVPSTWPNVGSTKASIGTLLSFGRYFDGLIPSIKIYNKTLNNTEITQNYNALKGRFGL
jgi:hypothetical protein